MSNFYTNFINVFIKNTSNKNDFFDFNIIDPNICLNIYIDRYTKLILLLLIDAIKNNDLFNIKFIISKIEQIRSDICDQILINICLYQFNQNEIGEDMYYHHNKLLGFLCISDAFDIIIQILSHDNVIFNDNLQNSILNVLFCASQKNRTEVFQLFVEKGIDLSKYVNFYNETLLHTAACNGSYYVVIFLINTKQFDINDSNNNRKHTPIYKAFRKFHINIFKLLIDNGAIANEDTLNEFFIEKKYCNYFGGKDEHMSKYIEMMNLI